MAFYYYGRKKRIIDRYPTARYDTVIEPFAGSASYSCRPDHRSRTVRLFDRDPDVVEAWRWLLSLTDDELANLDRLEAGTMAYRPVEIMHMASKRWWTYRKATTTPLMAGNWAKSLRYWPTIVPEIRHWEVAEGSYLDAPDVEATWFIDPPYPGPPGDGYRFGSKLLDYGELADWCRSRRGQVIVCSAGDDDWLPFVPFVELTGVGSKRSVEGIWTNDDSHLVGVGEQLGLPFA